VNPELQGLDSWERNVLERVLRIMRQVDRRFFREIYRDGLVHVLRQPEFLAAEKSQRLIGILEQRSHLEPILRSILEANGVQIIIGGEGTYDEIEDVTLVLSPYGVKGEASGVLGVLGPTRMHYAHAVSTVQYIAQLMDDLIADVYDVNVRSDTLSLED
jgi:heat-inducible transcriptional repressor